MRMNGFVKTLILQESRRRKRNEKIWSYYGRRQWNTFWPLSREARPKQFLDLCGTDKMINLTIDRLQGVVEPENIFVVTNEKQADALLQITE